MFLNMKKLYKICAEKVYDYYSFDKQIAELNDQLHNKENKDINSFIKSKNKTSNQVENFVIRKMMIENKINEKIIWQEIIGNIINGYKETHEYKYNYIVEKFMNHRSDQNLEKECFISTTTQSRYKTELLSQIALVALSKNLIVLSEVQYKKGTSKKEH